MYISGPAKKVNSLTILSRSTSHNIFADFLIVCFCKNENSASWYGNATEGKSSF